MNKRKYYYIKKTRTCMERKVMEIYRMAMKVTLNCASHKDC